MLTLVWPWALIVLPLPLLVYFLLPRTRLDGAALLVPFYQELGSLTSGHRDGGRKRPFRMLVMSLIWILLVAAVSRPQWIGDPVSLPAKGRDLLLAVDTSGSMAQEDMVSGGQRVSRLSLVKKIAGDFIDRRVGDRVGLILFGTHAYIQTPLTFDRHTVKVLLNEALIGIAGKKTSIGDAIGLAVKHLRKRPAQSRVLIILTDGSNTAGKVEPLTAAKLAAQTGVKIYTIGIGADEMVVQSFFGRQRVNPSADLDEDTLNKIATSTGGLYFRARNPAELKEIYQLIDRLEPVAQKSRIYRPVQALYYLPLAGGLCLSLLLVLFMTMPGLPWLGRRR